MFPFIDKHSEYPAGVKTPSSNDPKLKITKIKKAHFYRNLLDNMILFSYFTGSNLDFKHLK